MRQRNESQDLEHRKDSSGQEQVKGTIQAELTNGRTAFATSARGKIPVRLSRGLAQEEGCGVASAQALEIRIPGARPLVGSTVAQCLHCAARAVDVESHTETVMIVILKSLSCKPGCLYCRRCFPVKTRVW